MATSPLSPDLLARFVDRVRARFGDAALPPAPREAFAPPLAAALDAAHAAWPALAVPDDARFCDHLADRLPADSAPREALARVRAADLFLALACALGDNAALAAFDQAYGEELRRAAGRERAIAADDLVQQVRARLFTGPSPRIGEYAGQGELRAWLRVTATRAVVDAARRRSDLPAPDGDLAAGALAEPDPSDDPELAYLKRLYRREFQAAFEAAVGDLTPAERNVLRWHYLQNLGIDQIAATHGMHRATAARQIQRARAALLAATRKRLTDKLRLGDAELDSVMRMIESQVHVSVHRVLERAAPE